LTNAVRHGNRNDPGKTVDFRIQINDMKSIALRIADQGEGFDWQKQKTTGLLIILLIAGLHITNIKGKICPEIFGIG
jgi:nitrate/nitrite-specific signal transduction histidine kinase